MNRALAIVMLAGVAACAQLRYAYEPVTLTSADMDGHAAAVLAMPADAPKGELRIVALGVEKVNPPPGVGRPSFHALFARFVIDNQSDEAWTFDEAEQHIDVDGASSWAVTPTGERPPVMRIGAHTTAPFDVLFPVGTRDEGALARFEIQWTLRPGAHLVAGRAPFTRRTTTRETSAPAFAPALPPPPRLHDPMRAIPPDPCLP